ncbi:MAG TPA: phosphatidylserine decarboxylase [Gammaproteobacteria bacterium]|nr:phosphatidylserine decarboxylase [Gammaproteobacteria bacterium]
MTLVPRVAREGLWLVLATAFATIVALHFFGLRASLPLWALGLLLLVVFRDPEREIPSQPMAVVSPADGRVTFVGMTRDPCLERDSIRITLQMNPWGVFTTRSPVEGKVLQPPSAPSGTSKPHGVWLQTDEGHDVFMVMMRGCLRIAPRCYVRIGDRTGQGQRCGFVHLGGPVDVYLPERSRVSVTVGDRVRSGADVIATLPHA